MSDLRAAFFERIVAAFHQDGEVARSQPGYRLRPSQVAFAQAVGAALEARSTLVAEAGTGIGKTFGYLVPALLSGGMVLVSTGTRTLQDQLFRRDLPRVRDALRVGTRVALLKGRANYVCRYHLRRNLEDGRFDRREDVVVLHRIDRFASVTTTGDRSDASSIPEDAPAWARATSTRENCLGQDCPDLRECFVFKARQAAQEADLVVVNHHLLCADLALRDEGVADLLPTAQAIIFDEAHQLPDIASQFFGRSVSSRQLVEFARDAMREGLSEAADAADWITLNRRLEQCLRQWRLAVSGSGRLDRDRLIANHEFGAATVDVVAALQAFREPLQGAAERGLEVARLASRALDLERLLGQWRDGLVGAHGMAEGTPEIGGSVLWADVGVSALVLHATPLSLAEVFDRHRQAIPRGWVFVSATLAVDQDFSHFTGLLGLNESRCEAWPSPFDTPQQALLYVPPCGDPAAAEFADRVAASITPLLEANRGRAFILCTSLRMVEQLAERLTRRAQSSSTPVEWLVQGQLPRNELLSRFREASAPALIGSASFWEGVDVVGEQLSLVVIDKLPFAPPDDPVLRARGEALRRRGGDPFGLIQLPAAAMALKQGAGRLIRSEQDRGLLVICDERLVSRGYGRKLRASLPAMPITRKPEDALTWIRRGHQPAVPVRPDPLGLAPEAPPASGFGRGG